MNTEVTRTLNHEEENMTTVRPCVLCDSKVCGSCKWYDSVSGTCNDGTPRAPTSWCHHFTWA